MTEELQQEPTYNLLHRATLRDIQALGLRTKSGLDGQDARIIDIEEELSLAPVYIKRKNQYRGQCIGTRPTLAQKQSIAAGTYEDMYLGDYWEDTVSYVDHLNNQYTNQTIRFTIVDFRLWNGKVYCVVLGQTLFPCDYWDTNTIGYNYASAYIYTTVRPAVVTIVKDFFGADMVNTTLQDSLPVGQRTSAEVQVEHQAYYPNVRPPMLLEIWPHIHAQHPHHVWHNDGTKFGAYNPGYQYEPQVPWPIVRFASLGLARHPSSGKYWNAWFLDTVWHNSTAKAISAGCWGGSPYMHVNGTSGENGSPHIETFWGIEGFAPVVYLDYVEGRE